MPAPKRPPLTHFLCIPLVTSSSRPQLEKSLTRFSAELRDGGALDSTVEENPSGSQATARLPYIHPKAIRPVGALHCTLGVMSLNPHQVSQAIQLLKSLDLQGMLKGIAAQTSSTSEATPVPTTGAVLEFGEKHEPLEVQLKGLVSMHKPESTSILYVAPEDTTGRLYPLCTRLQQEFKDHGSLVADDRPLKLHATIVNTIYAKGRRNRAGAASSDSGSAGHGPNANAPLKIDATTLLQEYQDFVWAENLVLDRIAICEMGAKKITDTQGEEVDQEYTEVATLALPR